MVNGTTTPEDLRKERSLAEWVDFVQRLKDWVFNEVGYFCQAIGEVHRQWKSCR